MVSRTKGDFGNENTRHNKRIMKYVKHDARDVLFDAQSVWKRRSQQLEEQLVKQVDCWIHFTFDSKRCMQKFMPGWDRCFCLRPINNVAFFRIPGCQFLLWRHEQFRL